MHKQIDLKNMPQTPVEDWGLFLSIIFLFYWSKNNATGCPGGHLLTISVYVINRIKICTIIYDNNNNTVNSVENERKKEQPTGK